MKQVAPESPALTKNIHIKGRKLHFALVPSEQPYYISDEVSAALWRKIRSSEPPESDKGKAIGMPWNERVQFAEECSRIVKLPLSVATIEETDSALHKGIISPPKHKKRERSAREVHRSRKAREKLSPWTELVGIRLSLPDDPILLEFKGDTNEKRSLRLVIHIR